MVFENHPPLPYSPKACKRPLPAAKLELGESSVTRSTYAGITVIWIGGITVLLSCMISAYVLWNSHSQSESSAQSTLETSAVLLERSITHAVGSVDVILTYVQSGAKEALSSSIQNTSPLLHRLVSESLRSSPHIRQVLIVDGRNTILADSANPLSAGQALSPKAYGLEQSGPLSLGSRLKIGRASSGRYISPGTIPADPSTTKADGPWVIPVMLEDEANASDPRHIIAAMNPGWFLEMLSAARPGPNGEAIIVRLDGPVLAALPLYLENGTPSRSAILGGILDQESGATSPSITEEPSLLGHKSGLHVKRLSDVYPLSFVLTAVREDIQAAWLLNNHLLLVSMVLTPLGIGILFIFLTLDVRNQYALGERIRLVAQAMEQSPAALMITSPDGAILYANQYFADIFEYTLANVEGRNPRFLKSGKVADHVYKNMWNTITAGKIWHGELTNRTRSGEDRRVDTTISAVHDGRGRIACYVCIQFPITDQDADDASLITSD